jgi:hypothetical protein
MRREANFQTPQAGKTANSKTAPTTTIAAKMCVHTNLDADGLIYLYAVIGGQPAHLFGIPIRVGHRYSVSIVHAPGINTVYTLVDLTTGVHESWEDRFGNRCERCKGKHDV